MIGLLDLPACWCFDCDRGRVVGLCLGQPLRVSDALPEGVRLQVASADGSTWWLLTDGQIVQAPLPPCQEGTP